MQRLASFRSEAATVATRSSANRARAIEICQASDDTHSAVTEPGEIQRHAIGMPHQLQRRLITRDLDVSTWPMVSSKIPMRRATRGCLRRDKRGAAAYGGHVIVTSRPARLELIGQLQT